MAKELRSAAHRRLVRLVTERREALGLSQEALANKMGVDKGIVWRTETGDRMLDFLEFPKYAKALEMSRREFVEAVFGPEPNE